MSFLIVSSAFAQNAPIETTNETIIKKVKIENQDDVITNKVRVETTKEQLVMTDSSFGSSTNADRVFPKVKVTKTINIDNDKDPFYDSDAIIQYYILNDDTYEFKTNNKGFTIFKNNMDPFAMATRSNSGQFYFLTMEPYTGVGYFDENSNFIVEYFNSETGINITETFEVK